MIYINVTPESNPSNYELQADQFELNNYKLITEEKDCKKAIIISGAKELLANDLYQSACDDGANDSYVYMRWCQDSNQKYSIGDNYITDVFIGNDLSSLGVGCFSLFNALSNVEINQNTSLSTINDIGFWGCKNLSSIILPENIDSIGNGSYANCLKLKSINDNYFNFKSLGSYCFVNAPIDKVVFSEKLRSLGCGIFINIDNSTVSSRSNSDKSYIYSLFVKYYGTIVSQSSTNFTGKIKYNTDLKAIEINKNAPLETIEVKDFYKCAELSSVKLNDNLKTIKLAAFADCSKLKEIKLPEGFTTLEQEAFANCIELSNIVIPNTLTTIGAYSFSNCTKLSSFSMPHTVKVIPEGLFSGATDLSMITYGQDLIDKWDSEELKDSTLYPVPTLTNINAFDNIDLNYKINVPKHMYNRFRIAENWSNIKDHIWTKNIPADDDTTVRMNENSTYIIDNGGRNELTIDRIAKPADDINTKMKIEVTRINDNSDLIKPGMRQRKSIKKHNIK